MNMHQVYKLVGDGGLIRYIGITKKSLNHRLSAHMAEAKRSPRNTHRLNWLRSLLQPPPIVLVEQVLSDPAVRETYWISLARSYGCGLVNTSDGGDGVRDASGATGAKISAALRGRKASPETRARMSEAGKRRVHVPHTPEHCAAISAGKKGKPASPITIAASVAAKTGKRLSPEHCAAISAGKKGRPLSPATIAASAAAKRGKPLTPEHRAKLSEAQAARRLREKQAHGG